MLVSCMVVGIGGFAGSILRYLCSSLAPSAPVGLPTLLINAVGSFVLAALTTWTLKGALGNEQLSLMLRVGLCGGFTTFSTFSVEALQLLEGDKPYLGLVYLTLSCALGLVAAYLGSVLAR